MYKTRSHRLGGDGDFDVDTWLKGDGGDLTDNVRRSGQVDQTLVDLELVSVPSLGTFTVWL